MSPEYTLKRLARDVQDAQVPQRPWMAESGPDRIDSSLRSSPLRGALTSFVRLSADFVALRDRMASLRSARRRPVGASARTFALRAIRFEPYTHAKLKRPLKGPL